MFKLIGSKIIDIAFPKHNNKNKTNDNKKDNVRLSNEQSVDNKKKHCKC